MASTATRPSLTSPAVETGYSLGDPDTGFTYTIPTYLDVNEKKNRQHVAPRWNRINEPTSGTHFYLPIM